MGWRHFRDHGGTLRVVQTVGVGVALVVRGVVVWIRDGWPWPSIALLVGAAIPWLVRPRLVAWEHVLTALRTFAILLLVGVATSRWWSAGADEQTLLVALFVLSALYLSAYAAVLSSPRLGLHDAPGRMVTPQSARDHDRR